MYVYLSWAYTNKVVQANLDLLNGEAPPWFEFANAKEKDKWHKEKKENIADTFPEYHKLLEVEGEVGDDNVGLDSFNRNLLAIKFVIPKLERVATFKLPSRIPSSGKLPVSLASAGFLLNTFTGEWSGDNRVKSPGRVTFVGLSGLRQLFSDLAFSCAALDQPLPFSLWQSENIIELPEDPRIYELAKACGENCDNPQDKARYIKIIDGWYGAGVSADRDSLILTTVSQKLGIKD